MPFKIFKSRSHWPRGLRCASTAAHALTSWVRIPPGAWMSVCCECCVFSGRGVCDELITRPEDSHRLWCVVCGLENTSLVNEEEGQGPIGCIAPKKKIFNLLKPNDIYICRTAALTSRRYILNIYSTNIHTEYFKHAA